MQAAPRVAFPKIMFTQGWMPSPGKEIYRLFIFAEGERQQQLSGECKSRAWWLRGLSPTA
jgi:hypothetical protein